MAISRRRRREHQGKVPGAGGINEIPKAKPKQPSKQSRAEHAGRVPQPGVPAGPRQTVPAKSGYLPPGSSPELVAKTRRRQRREHAGKIPGAGGIAQAGKIERAKERRNRIMRGFEAEDFRQEAYERIAKSKFKLKDGEVQYRHEKVPVIKTSPKRIASETNALKTALREMKKQGASKKQLRTARTVGAATIAHRNYKLTPQGDIKFRDQKVPKLKVKPKALNKALRKVDKRAKEIEQGKRKHKIVLKGETIHKTWATEAVPAVAGAVGDIGGEILGKLPVPGPLGTPVEIAKKVTGSDNEDVAKLGLKATGAAAKATAQYLKSAQEQEDRQLRTAGLGFIPDARNAALKGTRTGLLWGAEYLTRPGLVVQQQVAQELAGANGPLNNLSGGIFKLIGKATLDEKGREKLKKSSKLEALLHGHAGEGVITGGDITEHTLGLPQLGLPLEIALDPLMYIGFAGLPAKFGEKAVSIAARLERVAPGVLKGNTKFTNLMKAAQESGDYETVLRFLENVAKDNNVSLRRLGRTKEDKAAIKKLQEGIDQRNKEIHATQTAQRNVAPEIRGEKLYLGGLANKMASEEIARMALRKQLEPGFTFELRTPLGKQVAGLRVPIPRRIAEARLIPQLSGLAKGLGGIRTESAKLMNTMRALSAQQKVYRDYAEEYKRRLDELDDLEYGTQEHRAKTRELNEFEDKVRTSILNARLEAVKPSEHTASLKEVIDRYNSKRYQHEVARISRAQGRAVQQTAMHYVERAFGPILRDQKSRVRVNMHMHARADTGISKLLDEVAPLNKKELRVLDDLRKIYTELERYGLEVGTLKSALKGETYVPRTWTTSDDILGPLRGDPLSEEILPMGGRQGAKSFFEHHRSLPELATIADKTKLAHAIKTIATKNIDDATARRIAEIWHDRGKIRLSLEDLAQAVNRGAIIHWDELTDLQKAAYEWQKAMRTNGEPVPALFKDVEATEGILKLNPDQARFHDLVEVPFDGLSTHDEFTARIASALEGRQRLQEARDAAADNAELARQYDLAIEQRTAEIAKIREEYKGSIPSQQKTIPVREVGGAPEGEVGKFFEYRQPFMYDKDTKTIYLGAKGTIHDDSPEMAALMEKGNYVQGELLHPGYLGEPEEAFQPLFKYGSVDVDHPEAVEVQNALRAHTGIDFRTDAEWKALETRILPEETTAAAPELAPVKWKRKKDKSGYAGSNGEDITKVAKDKWMLKREAIAIPEEYPTLKAAKEAAEPEPPPDVDALRAEAQAIEGELPKQQSELEKLRGEVGSQQWVVALKNEDGTIDRYLARQTDRNSAELSADDMNSSGMLPPGQTAEAVVDPTTTAASRKEAAEAFATKAGHIESMEDELANIHRMIDEAETKPATPAVTTELRTQPPTPATDAAAAPTAQDVGLATDEEIANMVPNATDEYIGSLRDFRNDHPEWFPVIDPLLANFHRTRAEGLQTIFRTRWSTLDKTAGRSEREALTGRWKHVDGRDGFVSDLKPVYDIDGEHPSGWQHRETGEVFAPHELEFPERTLIPNANKDIWTDPITGREYIRAFATNPNVAESMREIVGPDRLWPTDVVTNARAEFLRYGETGVHDLYDAGFEAGFNRLLALSRYGVTTLFPAYHMRNMMSDVIQSMMADPSTILAHPIAAAKLTWATMTRGGEVKVAVGGGKYVTFLKSGHVRVPGWGKINMEDYLATMDAFGLRSNQHLAELAQLAERGEIGARAATVHGRVGQSAMRGFGLGPTGAVGRRAIEFGARREDIMRALTFTQRMRRNNGDFADAMWWTIKHHFDYGDLSLVERRKWRNLFLFYTWYRKNIPLQFLTMIRRPGFFSAVTNTYIASAEGEAPWRVNWSKIAPWLPDMSGPMPHSALVPDYMFNQLSSLSTSWNGHTVAIGFGAPWENMNLITHFFEDPEEAGRQVFGLFNPALTLPAQAIFKRDLLTGREFGLEETSGSAQILDYIAQKFGLDGLQRDEEGNPVLPWALNLAMNYFPVAGRFSGYMRPTGVTEDQGLFNQLFGGSGPGTFLTGINAYVTPKEGERLHLAYISRVMARGQQRRAYAESMSNLPDATREARLREFDKETYQELVVDLGVPYKYLEVVPSIGKAYVTQEEREGLRLGGKSPLLGGSSGSPLLKDRSSTLGGANLEGHREFKGESEEALEKYLKPGQFEEGLPSSPLIGQSFVPFFGESDAYTGELEAGAERFLPNLEANRLARRGNPQEKLGGRQNAAQRALRRPVITRAEYERRTANKLPDMAPKRKDLTRAEKALKAPVVTKAMASKATKQRTKTAVKKIKQQFPELKQNNAARWIAEAARKYDVPADLLASIYAIESASGSNATESSAGAQGPMQFIPSTWEMYGVRADGSKASPTEIHDTRAAMHSAANYLKASGWVTGDPDAEYQAIYSYNHADWYVNDVQTGRSKYRSKFWGDIAAAGARAGRKRVWEGPKKHGKVEGELFKEGTKDVQRLGRRIAGIAGFPIHVWNTLRPGDTVASGGPSDHASGNAMDIEATSRAGGGTLADERRGDKIATAAYIAAGGKASDPEWKEFLAEGGAFDVISPSGYRVQIIWKTPEWGGHEDHVHVGIRHEGADATAGNRGYSGGGTIGGYGGTTNAAGETISPGYHPGREKRKDKLLAKLLAGEAVEGVGGGGGGSSSASLLTTNEAFNLGSGADIPEPIRRPEPKEVISQRVKKPKFNLKSGTL